MFIEGIVSPPHALGAAWVAYAGYFFSVCLRTRKLLLFYKYARHYNYFMSIKPTQKYAMYFYGMRLFVGPVVIQ